jgi:hypothetical protein
MQPGFEGLRVDVQSRHGQGDESMKRMRGASGSLRAPSAARPETPGQKDESA